MLEKINVKKEDIRNLLEKLLQEKGIAINTIVLFGSFVKGNFGQESDIDVIIVSPNFRDKSIIERAKLTTGVGRELVKRFKIPFDLIYYSDEEWERKDYILINEAKEYGEVIYG